MRRMLTLVLSLVLLAGCGTASEAPKDPATEATTVVTTEVTTTEATTDVIITEVYTEPPHPHPARFKLAGNATLLLEEDKDRWSVVSTKVSILYHGWIQDHLISHCDIKEQTRYLQLS